MMCTYIYTYIYVFVFIFIFIFVFIFIFIHIYIYIYIYMWDDHLLLVSGDGPLDNILESFWLAAHLVVRQAVVPLSLNGALPE